MLDLKPTKPIEAPFFFLLAVCLVLNVYAFVLFSKTDKRSAPIENPINSSSLPATTSSVNVENDQPSPVPQFEVSTSKPKRLFPSEFYQGSSSTEILPDENPTKEILPFGSSLQQQPNVSNPILSSPKSTDSRGPSITKSPPLEFWGFDEEELNREIVNSSSNNDLAKASSTTLPIPLSDENETFSTSTATELEEPSLLPPEIIEVSDHQTGKNYLYNIPVRGQKVLFIIEASVKMTAHSDGAVLSIENELKRVINALENTQTFNIIAFQGDRISLCEADYMPVNNANKAFSMLWLRGHFQNVHKQKIIEDNKPDGYPEIFASASNLEWAEPLFMGMHSYPDEIFLITSNWYSDLEEHHASDASQFWTREKQALWRSAYEETTNWLEEENRSRKAQRIAPRAVISIGALISKRHPNIEQPPEELKQADAVLIKELDEIVYSRGLDNRLSLNTILYAMGKEGDISDIYKYSHLARKYLGQFVLVEGSEEVKNF